MITFQEAQKLVLNNTSVLPVEEENIYNVFRHVLAEDVEADVNLPSFSNSAMDGFAIRSEDAKKEGRILKIIDCIRAGDSPLLKVTKGEAVKIMTGAPLPEGADAVIMKEHTDENESSVVIKKTVKKGENVRFRGEEIKKGQAALKKGQTLNPASLGFLISLGRKNVQVYKKPDISILVTGNELMAPGSKLDPGQIWESNSALLRNSLYEAGFKPRFLGIAKDKTEDLESRMDKGLNSSDVLIVSGGISVGDYDLVQKVLEKLEVKKIFWRVAIKPGKPTYFGKKGEKLVFGLPGNPASVLVTFLEFVRPALLKMMGYQDVFLEEKQAYLEHVVRKKPDRAHFLKGYFQEKNGVTSVRSAGKQNSHILESFSRANCLILLEKNRTVFEIGEKIKIQLLPWK